MNEQLSFNPTIQQSVGMKLETNRKDQMERLVLIENIEKQAVIVA